MNKTMQAIWAGTIFFLLGYFPVMFMMGRPGVSILAAAIGSVPYGMSLCSGLRGMLRGLWLGAIAGLAMFLALSHLWNMTHQPADAAATAASASAPATAGATVPATAPASVPATATSTQPAGGAASQPTSRPFMGSSPPGLDLLGICIASQMVVCAGVCAAAGWLAKRRKKLIDRQWEDSERK